MGTKAYPITWWERYR
jgi:hypothetical protein